MTKDPNETPLFALKAVAVDTETTGLDPERENVIEIGAFSWPEDVDGSLQTFVAIHKPVPAEAARITGIDDGMLAGAVEFPLAFEKLRAFAGERVLIGHSFGFDIAIFAAECARHGLEQWRPVSLDTRFLAQIALPNLPDYSLETLTSRLSVDVDQRHRALADAMATAKVFAALVPLLRERNIRTLGEAIAACKRFEERTDYPKVWAPLAPAETLQAEDAAIAPLDTFLFTQDVASVMTALPLFVAPETTIGEAAAQMARAKSGSILVGVPGGTAETLGIATERDVLRAIGAPWPRGVWTSASKQ